SVTSLPLQISQSFTESACRSRMGIWIGRSLRRLRCVGDCGGPVVVRIVGGRRMPDMGRACPCYNREIAAAVAAAAHAALCGARLAHHAGCVGPAAGSPSLGEMSG